MTGIRFSRKLSPCRVKPRQPSSARDSVLILDSTGQWFPWSQSARSNRSAPGWDRQTPRWSLPLVAEPFFLQQECNDVGACFGWWLPIAPHDPKNFLQNFLQFSSPKVKSVSRGGAFALRSIATGWPVLRHSRSPPSPPNVKCQSSDPRASRRRSARTPFRNPKPSVISIAKTMGQRNVAPFAVFPKWRTGPRKCLGRVPGGVPSVP